MRVLLYGINYAPELTGIGKYSGEMAAWLANQGHTVSVITGMPYYPAWKVDPKYKGKAWHVEHVDGVTVYRCPLYVPSALSAKTRILQELSFILSSFPVGIKKLFSKRADVVVNICPPFHLSLFPLLYGMIRRVPVVTHVQDLQVDVARDLNMIRNKKVLGWMLKMERWMFNRSSLVSTISKGMQRKIVEKDIPAHKCVLLPNWVDEHAVKPMSKEQSLYKAFGLSVTDRIILYSGNLGEKQGLDIIIEAAERFRERKDVYFIIVGSGGAEKRLKALAADADLPNLKFFPLQPYEQLSALLATADLHLVLQRSRASDLVMPSKLTGILSSGGASIVTAEKGTTLFDLISTHQLGILIEPENINALVQAITKGLEMDLTTIRNNARRYAESHLSKDAIMQKWESALGSLSAGFPTVESNMPQITTIKLIQPEEKVIPKFEAGNNT
jgi:colanic acid biosynthesis glycosyl transferase WcaI